MCLGGLLGFCETSGRILGAPWMPFDGLLGALGRLWAPLGVSWVIRGLLWGALGPFWKTLGGLLASGGGSENFLLKLFNFLAGLLGTSRAF